MVVDIQVVFFGSPGAGFSAFPSESTRFFQHYDNSEKRVAAHYIVEHNTASLIYCRYGLVGASKEGQLRGGRNLGICIQTKGVRVTDDAIPHLFTYISDVFLDATVNELKILVDHGETQKLDLYRFSDIEPQLKILGEVIKDHFINEMEKYSGFVRIEREFSKELDPEKIEQRRKEAEERQRQEEEKKLRLQREKEEQERLRSERLKKIELEKTRETSYNNSSSEDSVVGRFPSQVSWVSDAEPQSLTKKTRIKRRFGTQFRANTALVLASVCFVFQLYHIISGGEGRRQRADSGSNLEQTKTVATIPTDKQGEKVQKKAEVIPQVENPVVEGSGFADEILVEKEKGGNINYYLVNDVFIQCAINRRIEASNYDQLWLFNVIAECVILGSSEFASKDVNALAEDIRSKNKGVASRADSIGKDAVIDKALLRNVLGENVLIGYKKK
ncbi:MAG: hypothetical protein H6602_07620 [Flavobacteriales bacterium]|nr:hypothetical protein [Flavobacteriales bacterium]